MTYISYYPIYIFSADEIKKSKVCNQNAWCFEASGKKEWAQKITCIIFTVVCLCPPHYGYIMWDCTNFHMFRNKENVITIYYESMRLPSQDLPWTTHNNGLCIITVDCLNDVKCNLFDVRINRNIIRTEKAINANLRCTYTHKWVIYKVILHVSWIIERIANILVNIICKWFFGN